jgi:hypothetical protein
MTPSLTTVIERFPNARAHATHLYDRDEDFRDLCDEYEVCRRAEDRLEGGKPPIRREYAALRLRLEGELLRYLEQHPDDETG